jgi:hypothetical protein
MSTGEVKYINGKRVASPEYRTWQMMRNRCLNQNAQDYDYYGGRGITICDQWSTFDGFLADMGRRPAPKYTLDRIDSDGAYEPSNCRWATRKEQSRNRSYAKTQAYKLAEQLGVKSMTAHHYIWQVRAKDRGITKGVWIEGELEVKVRTFLKEQGV